MTNELNEAFLNNKYEEFQNIHIKLLNDFKNDNKITDKQLQKKIIIINTIILNIIKLRNILISIKK